MRMILLKEGEPMPKRMLMEQFHLTMTVPAGLTTVEYEAMRRTLQRKCSQKTCVLPRRPRAHPTASSFSPSHVAKAVTKESRCPKRFCSTNFI